jgi:hypothetical protein
LCTSFMDHTTYNDKKVVSVFVPFFRAPLESTGSSSTRQSLASIVRPLVFQEIGNRGTSDRTNVDLFHLILVIT